MQNNPLVTIGIPIYYGETFIKQTLDNILEQDYKHYEIIITDNNPGGEPEQIAKEYAKSYNNITYITHNKPAGALSNWNACLEHARGEYFIYAGAHDLWSESFLSVLVNTLETDKSAVLAYAPSYFMTENGQVLSYSSGFFDCSGLTTIARFNMVFWGGQDALYGLIRTSAIKKTRKQLQIVGSGVIWLNELSLLGNFIVNPEVRRFRRVNRKESSREQRLTRYHKTLFDTQRLRIMPFLRMFVAYLCVPFVVRTGIFLKLRLLISITVNFCLRYGHDVVFDFISILKRPFIKHA